MVITSFSSLASGTKKENHNTKERERERKEERERREEKSHCKVNGLRRAVFRSVAFLIHPRFQALSSVLFYWISHSFQTSLSLLSLSHSPSSFFLSLSSSDVITN